MAVSVAKYKDIGPTKYLNDENPIGPDYLEPESVMRTNFTGKAHIRRFSSCNLYGGESLEECQDLLEDLISNARINFSRVYGTEFQIPNIRDRESSHLFNDLQTMGVIYTAKHLMDYYAKADGLDIPYDKFVNVTFNYFYEHGLYDFNFQENAMSWLRFIIPPDT